MHSAQYKQNLHGFKELNVNLLGSHPLIGHEEIYNIDRNFGTAFGFVLGDVNSTYEHYRLLNVVFFRKLR